MAKVELSASLKKFLVILTCPPSAALLLLKGILRERKFGFSIGKIKFSLP